MQTIPILRSFESEPKREFRGSIAVRVLDEDGWGAFKISD
jgi:hypothetical protein